MVNKRAQGLPLSFIVIAAIAVLVLVVVVAFVIFGLGGSFKGISTQTTSDLEAIRTACQTNCNKLNGVVTEDNFKNSDYCKKTYSVDRDGDGKINGETTGCSSGLTFCNSEGDGESGLLCRNDPINVKCSITASGGKSLTDSNC